MAPQEKTDDGFKTTDLTAPPEGTSKDLAASPENYDAYDGQANVYNGDRKKLFYKEYNDQFYDGDGDISSILYNKDEIFFLRR